MPFEFKRLEIPEVLLIEPRVFPDHRGIFWEAYKRSEFKTNGISARFAQDNYSRSVQGTLRGLHYQKLPEAQGKLVMVIQGEIFDVAIDIRKNSPTFGRWIGQVLSADNLRMLWIPVGFAHGFYILSAMATVVYKVAGGEYTPTLERGIIWNDPDIGICWPVEDPLLSEKDAVLPSLSEADNNFMFQGESP